MEPMKVSTGKLRELVVRHDLVSSMSFVFFAATYIIVASSAQKDFMLHSPVRYYVACFDRWDKEAPFGAVSVISLALFFLLTLVHWLPESYTLSRAGVDRGMKAARSTVVNWGMVSFVTYGIADMFAYLAVAPLAGVQELVELLAAGFVIFGANWFFGHTSTAKSAAAPGLLHPDRHLVWFAALFATVPYAVCVANLIAKEGITDDFDPKSDAAVMSGIIIWVSFKVILNFVHAITAPNNPDSEARVQTAGLADWFSQQAQTWYGKMMVGRMVGAFLMFSAAATFSFFYLDSDLVRRTYSPIVWVVGGEIVSGGAWPACEVGAIGASGALLLIWGAHIVHYYFVDTRPAAERIGNNNDPFGLTAWAVSSALTMALLCMVSNVNQATEMITLTSVTAIGIVLHGIHSPVEGKGEDGMALATKGAIAVAPMVMVAIKLMYGDDGDVDTGVLTFAFVTIGLYSLYFVVDSFMRMYSASSMLIGNRMVFHSLVQLAVVANVGGHAYSGLCLTKDQSSGIVELAKDYLAVINN